MYHQNMRNMNKYDWLGKWAPSSRSQLFKKKRKKSFNDNYSDKFGKKNYQL